MLVAWISGGVLEEQLGGAVAQFVGGLPDGGQGHDPVGRKVDVVVADQGYVVGHTESGAGEPSIYAEGHHVVAAEDAGGHGAIKQAAGGEDAVLDANAVLDHLQHRLARFQAGAGQGFSSAYRLRAGSWDSEVVRSQQSILVPYAGPALCSGQRLEWTVKVWTDLGESEWSVPAFWEMGLLDPSDWTARWIEPHDAEDLGGRRPHPVRYLRGSVSLPEDFGSARLHVTAHGIYEFFINGHRVGDLELSPGFTSYESTLQVQAFDVATLLRPGPNVLGAILSGGWVKWTRLYRDRYPLGLLAQLNVQHRGTGLLRFGTGQGWVSGEGEIRTADLYEGEVVDRRMAQSDWLEPTVSLEGWKPVGVRDYDPRRLAASPSPPVRRVQELPPLTVARLSGGSVVVDLGQNINGWVRLRNLGPSGTTLTLTHGESLHPDGSVRPVTWPDTGWHESAPGAPFQQDLIVAAGSQGEVFEPRHTTHGFRYAQIDGHPGTIADSDVTGVVVHTDLRRTGWFECSDPRINRLHEAAVWSFRGNACEIPTDCPTRERVGWTGDWQIFFPSAAFLYDVAGFAQKWLRDLASDQRADGMVWHGAPNPEPLEQYASMPPGNAGFGDAAVLVPWGMYLAYGDLGILERQWDSMVRWVGYVERLARDHRHPSRVAVRPDAAPHERYLWDTGFHWGEWNEPGMLPPGASPQTVAEFVRSLHTADHGNVATADFHRSAAVMARVAELLGRASEATRYGLLANRVREAWQREFLGEDGGVLPGTQADHVRALAFGLVPNEKRGAVAANLVGLIRRVGMHLGTGFLSTPYLLPVLADTGHLDVAYALLFQDTEPSWLAMIDRGATTIWEQWNGIDEHGQAHESLNHYSKGSVITFLHQYVAGLRQNDDSAAYRRILIEPRPGGGITSAQARLAAPLGRIESTWHIDVTRFVLEVTIPPGCAAEVRLPDGSRHTARPGRTGYSCAVAPTTAK